MQKTWKRALWVAPVLLVAGLLLTVPHLRASTAQENLLLGNPSGATHVASNADNFLLERPQMTLSYNQTKGGPNWVAWHLERSDMGGVGRSTFHPDPMLPAAAQIRPNDYTGSHFDRGHMCPSADRNRTRADNNAVFVMSNILPQTAALNQHPWEKLEAYCRTRVKQGNEMYIVAGGHGTSGTIAHGKVNVPADTWKVIVELAAGDNDLTRINRNTRVIAVDMPNKQDIAAATWQSFIVTPAQIETATGYHFFTALPADVRTALEAKKDSGRAR